MFCLFFFQAEDGIRDLVRSRGLGDVYKRQVLDRVYVGAKQGMRGSAQAQVQVDLTKHLKAQATFGTGCLLYTSDAADERSSVDLGGRRIIKKKKIKKRTREESHK